MEASFQPSLEMLSATGARQRHWHEQAAAQARERFGRKVFVRGVVEVSNYCRENCSYCGMRRDNRSLARHRAELDTLVELLLRHRPALMTDLNIQSGEDPVAVRELVIPLVQTLKRTTPLGISVCLGTLDEALYGELRTAGAEMYIMKFETADDALYRQLRSPGTLAERLRHIRWLAANGWFVSSGFIAGLPGQTLEHLLVDCRMVGDLPLHGCSVSPFIPGDETPLGGESMGGADLTLNCMAALRLLQPGLVIPAVSALHLAENKEGYRRGLRTGGNLCTINLTPSGLRADYLLYKRDRFIMTEERLLGAIEAEGLEISGTSLLAHLRSARAAAAAETLAA